MTDTEATPAGAEPGPDGDPTLDVRRWMRDLGALLALPALWVDHEPREITEGLLSVLFGVLQLDAGYVRFDEPGDDRPPLECWRPMGARPPVEVQVVLGGVEPATAGASTREVDVPDVGRRRVTCIPVVLPWEHGLVVVSSARPDFPTERETHLLRTAVGQAAISIHTARRIAREQSARISAESALARQGALLASLVDEVGPTLQKLSSVAGHIEEAARLLDDVEVGVVAGDAMPATTPGGSPSARRRADPAPPPQLTRRETEVLGLLAQGLNNREIAGLMWLSDRTVERHITSLYRKIGVGRRSEATAFALRHGLG